MPTFTPVIYLKSSCRHCFKVQLFLLEAGIIDQVELRLFTPGDAEEPKIRAALAPHFEKVTFPTAELTPGVFTGESDDLINWFAAQNGIDPASLFTFQTYLNGPFKRIGDLMSENRQLKEKTA